MQMEAVTCDSEKFGGQFVFLRNFPKFICIKLTTSSLFKYHISNFIQININCINENDTLLPN